MTWKLVGTLPERETYDRGSKITKARLAQNIDNENPYFGIKAILPGQQPHSVLFEPLRHIRLSRSTYKVTTFVEFEPFIQSFVNFENYLHQFIEDLEDPKRVSGFVYLLTENRARILSTYQDRQFQSYLTNHPCNGRTNTNQVCRGIDKQTCKRQHEIVCRTKKQFLAVTDAAKYIEQSFKQVKKEFLSVIDHLENEEEEPNREERATHNYEVRQDLKLKYSRLDKDSLEMLNEILERIEEMNPDLKKKLKRVKRFGLMSWILGWGVFSNARQIRTLKKNVKILYQQNLLQEQQIQDLAQYLNLTATRVQLHDEMLYNIQVRLNKMNFSIAAMQDIIQYNMYTSNMLFDTNIVTNRLITGLIVLRNNVEQVYKYMRVIASQEVDPIMIPPPPLRDILANAKKEMAHNPRLELPYDPDKEIYKYYTVMKITPVVVGNVMAMLLTIPLIDKSLKMNVYKVHNLPALHPKLKIAAEYIVEGDYLAIDEHGLYVALPDPREIQICLTSQGGLCVMNQALHPIETVNWCIYALFIQDEERIKKDCTMNFKPRQGNLAQSLGGYLWAVSALVGERMQIRCLQETNVENIKPPLQVIHVGNGCEGYSPSIKIPAKSELTSQNDLAERTTYFLDFNVQYKEITKIGPWDLFEVSEWEEKELEDMVEMLPALPPMNYENLNKRIGKLKEYPLEIPVAIIAIALVVSTVFMVIIMLIICLVVYRMKGNFKVLIPLSKIIMGQASPKEIEKMKQILRNLLDLSSGSILPPDLPERRSQKAAPPKEQIEMATTGSTKNILPSSSDVQRLEKYLIKKEKERQNKQMV